MLMKVSSEQTTVSERGLVGVCDNIVGFPIKVTGERGGQ